MTLTLGGKVIHGTSIHSISELKNFNSILNINLAFFSTCRLLNKKHFFQC